MKEKIKFRIELCNVRDIVDMMSIKELKECIISFKLFDKGILL